MSQIKLCLVCQSNINKDHLKYILDLRNNMKIFDKDSKINFVDENTNNSRRLFIIVDFSI
jgi:hypothetical protein